MNQISDMCFQRDEKLRARLGARYDRFFEFLYHADPLADRVIGEFERLPREESSRLIRVALDEGIEKIGNASPALKALFGQLDRVPDWVDWEQLDTGGGAFLRSGVLGVFVIALRSLPMSYSSPAGNKPLVFSGRLANKAARRLGETGRFVYLTSQPDGLRRFSEGFKVNVKVRLMHAQVRRYLWTSGRWQPELWGEPINQSYMTATNLLLSIGLLDGMKAFGLTFTREQRAGLMQLWRYSAFLSGVAPELLFADEAEAREMLDMVFALDGPPDVFSRRLVSGLMGVSQNLGIRRCGWLRNFFFGISEGLIGRARARALEYPKTPWRYAVPVMYPFVRAADWLRTRIPAMDRAVDYWGAKGWNMIVKITLAGPVPDFTRPNRLETVVKGKA